MCVMWCIGGRRGRSLAGGKKLARERVLGAMEGSDSGETRWTFEEKDGRVYDEAGIR